MSSFLAGVIEDLKRRRLLPVAVLLLIGALALPIFMLKSAPETSPPPPAAATPASTDGLPGPNQALAGDRQLVSLAVLNESSNLDSFEPKDPFKPLEELSEVPDDGAPDTTPGGGGSTGIAPSADAVGGGGGGTGGTDGGTGQPGTPMPTPTPAPKTAPKPRKTLTYALDMSIRGPKGLRSYRGLPKLSVLPSTENPLLVFLGIEDAGTKAVFLVDAKLRSQDGEGTCSPSPTQCATLALAPGEEHTLVNDLSQSWTLRIVEVRETSVAKAAAAAKAAKAAQTRRARRSRAPVGDTPAPRFIPPIITDLFTGGRS